MKEVKCVRACVCASLVALVLAGGPAARAQGPAPHQPSSPPAALHARGWDALARGDQREASAVAAALRSTPDFRRNLASLTLLIQLELSGGGPITGLDAYEAWLGQRASEVVFALRPIAAAVLTRLATSGTGLAAAEARAALAADGDVTALRAVQTAVESGDPLALAVAAGRGDQGAVDHLVTQAAGPNVRAAVIDALGASGSPRAGAAVRPLLASDRDDLRAAAAAALGRLGTSEAIPELRRLLDEPMFHVRFAAAAALFRLGDRAGDPVLADAAASPHSGVRIGAAEALSIRPDAQWMSLVKGLTSDPDPMVRVKAARLLAAQEPAAAAGLLAELMDDGNPAIREVAGRTLSDLPDLPVARLRELLRHDDGLIQARAAARLLEMTR